MHYCTEFRSVTDNYWGFGWQMCVFLYSEFILMCYLMRHIIVIRINDMANRTISGRILLCCLLPATVVSANWQFQLATGILE